MAVPPASLSDRVLERVKKTLSGKADAKVRLKSALRELGKWRSALIQNSVVKTLGTAVARRPVQGDEAAGQRGGRLLRPKAPRLVRKSRFTR